MIQTELHQLNITSDKSTSATHPHSPPAHCPHRHNGSSATVSTQTHLWGLPFLINIGIIISWVPHVVLNMFMFKHKALILRWLQQRLIIIMTKKNQLGKLEIIL